jgi:hypothetical protein
MFNPFRARSQRAVEPTRTHVVVPSGGTQIPAHVVSASYLRRRPTVHVANEQPPKRGMWVVLGDRVGILKNIEAGDIATVMIVDDQGLNVVELHAPGANLRQAWYEEIPAARRPDYERAQRFGYHARPQ